MPAFGYESEDLRELRVTGVDPHHIPQRLTELADAELDNLAATAKEHRLTRLSQDIDYERRLRLDRVPQTNFYQFWIYDDSAEAPIKIVLNARDHAGEENAVAFEHGGQTEEGHRHCGTLYYIDTDDQGNTIIVAEFHETGADCDGGYEHHHINYCLPAELEAGQPARDHSANTVFESPIIPGIVYPKWQKKEAYQRDYAAEAAGY